MKSVHTSDTEWCPACQLQFLSAIFALFLWVTETYMRYARDHVTSALVGFHWLRFFIESSIKSRSRCSSSIPINVLSTLVISPLSLITPYVNVSVHQLAPTSWFLELGRSSANDRSLLLVRPLGILHQKLFAPSPIKRILNVLSKFIF